MVGRNRSRVQDSFYFENQTWGALHKAWKGYVIAKNKDEFERLEYYAEVIQKLQKELGLEISSLPGLGMIAENAADDTQSKASIDELTPEELIELLKDNDKEFWVGWLIKSKRESEAIFLLLVLDRTKNKIVGRFTDAGKLRDRLNSYRSDNPLSTITVIDEKYHDFSGYFLV